VYKNLVVADLKRKLLSRREVTQWLGRTKKVEAEDPKTFRRMLERYVDSSNAVTEGSFWPIVRKVTAEGRDWTALRTGATLVDAPGVNDDNGARDRVVKQYLKNADSVWIVSNIKRAVNDRTAKDMLSESFRRQLLMDGQYGQIVFVATQSDDLHASELRDNLGLNLAHDMPLRERRALCAKARNDYTRKRILDDFHEGVLEMSRAAGEDVDPQIIRERYDLPVFCVSSIDFQKLAGLRRGDGAAAVWRDAAGTEVPALREFVHERTLKRRRVTLRAHVEALVRFGDQASGLLTTSTQPTLNRHICMSIHPEGNLCGHVQSRLDCLFSMTLLRGGGAPGRQQRRRQCGAAAADESGVRGAVRGAARGAGAAPRRAGRVPHAPHRRADHPQPALRRHGRHGRGGAHKGSLHISVPRLLRVLE